MIIESIAVLGGLAFFFSLVINQASRRLAVAEDPLVAALEAVLPGTNCGACGQAGCRAAAELLASGRAETGICPAGGPAVAGEIARLLGVEHSAAAARVAFVHCLGDRDTCRERFAYRGVASCLAADMTAGGPKACFHGCLGLGDCVAACPFGALSIDEKGLALVDGKLCTGCGKCVPACPRKIITVLPRDREIVLACVSRARGKAVREACSRGCIACGACARVSPEGAVTMVDNLPVLHYGVTGDFSAAAAKCPMKCFVRREVEPAVGPGAPAAR